MKYTFYDKYIDSNVDWIGYIPFHWLVKRLKFLIEKGLQYGANEAAELDDRELPRYIRITDIDENGNLRENTFRSLPEEIAVNYLLKEGDILFARSGATVGKTFLYRNSWGTCAYAGYLIKASLKKLTVNPDFISYCTKSQGYASWISSMLIQATIQNVSAEKYASFIFPFPSLSEQISIAAFLDRETARIDALIEKKKKLIELLKEKRTALITRAVTKGLNKEVKMKPSGIEWLGEIPEHWEVKKIKLLLRLSRGVDLSQEEFLKGKFPVMGSNGPIGYHNVYNCKGP
jgi:type I restriction enzyme S subunit